MNIQLTLPLVALLLTSTQGLAAISGQVRDRSNEQPLAGIEVRLQAVPSSPVAITDSNGQFTLMAEPAGQVTIAAAKPFDPTAGAVNYATDVALTFNGASNVIIRLPPSPAVHTNPHTVQIASTCGGCHNVQRSEWSQSRHALAATNPWVLDVFSGTGTAGGSNGYVYTTLHPGQTGFCATCHAPMEDVFNPGSIYLNGLTTAAGADGVTCNACHQIAKVDVAQIDGLHHLSKTSYRFPNSNSPNTNFHVFGALPDVDDSPMRNIYSPLFAESLLCASCHQYKNPSTNAPGQDTYAQWLASPFAQPGPNFRACQHCHMPEASESNVLATGSSVERPASQIHSHRIVGSTPESLRQAIKLKLYSRIENNTLVVMADVENKGAGHSFPAGVSIRNAFVLLSAQVGNQALSVQSGDQIPMWANDDVPGMQDGDFGGFPGKGFAKILRGRINGSGPQTEPVLFIDAESVASDTLIPAGGTDTVLVRFNRPPVPLIEVQFSARLVWRRAFRGLAVSKGWTQAADGGPIEIEIAAQSRDAERLFRTSFEEF